jgi:hypothetical protein
MYLTLRELPSDESTHEAEYLSDTHVETETWINLQRSDRSERNMSMNLEILDGKNNI